MATTAAPAANSSNVSTLSEWSGPYVTNMLGKTQAFTDTPYQVYQGPMTAGESGLQSKVFQGLGSLNFPSNLGASFSSTGAPPPPPINMGAYQQQPIGTGNYNRPSFEQYTSTLQPGQEPAVNKNVYDAGLAGSDVYGQPNMQQPAQTVGSQPTTMFEAQANQQPQGIASQYMNPYLKSVLDPQLAELRRQAEITNQSGLGSLTKSGAFGGGRQAIMESEAARNLMAKMNETVGKGYSDAYDKAMGQFNTEQTQGQALAKMMAEQGATDRAMEAEQVAADKAQFEEARANPYKQVQFQQSLLDKLPIQTTNYNTVTPSMLETLSGNMTKMNELLGRLGLLETKP